MIDGKIFFDEPVKNDIKTYDKIRKIATGQGDDDTTGCLLDFYFKNYYKIIAIDLVNSKHSKAIQQISFTGNLDQTGNTTMFFIIEEAKENILDFSQGTVKAF